MTSPLAAPPLSLASSGEIALLHEFCDAHSTVILIELARSLHLLIFDKFKRQQQKQYSNYTRLCNLRIFVSVTIGISSQKTHLGKNITSGDAKGQIGERVILPAAWRLTQTGTCPDANRQRERSLRIWHGYRDGNVVKNFDHRRGETEDETTIYKAFNAMACKRPACLNALHVSSGNRAG